MQTELQTVQTQTWLLLDPDQTAYLSKNLGSLRYSNCKTFVWISE